MQKRARKMKLNDFWAKTEPFQSVVTHGLVSGHIAQVLVRSYLSPGTRKLLCAVLGLDENGLEGFVGYLVSLHDIGKIEYNFQAKNPAMLEKLRADTMYSKENGIPIPGVRHERTGQAGKFKLKAIGEPWESKSVQQSFSPALLVRIIKERTEKGLGQFQKTGMICRLSLNSK